MRGIIAALVLSTVACAHSDSYRVASAQNGRAYHKLQWDRACLPVKSLPGCDDAARTLLRWHKDETAAIEALKRGGSIADQLGALKRDRKAVRKAGVR